MQSVEEMKRSLREFNEEYDNEDPTWRKELGDRRGDDDPASALIAAAEAGLAAYESGQEEVESPAGEEHDLQCQQCNSVLFHATTLVTGECVCLPCAPKRMVPKGSETLDFGCKPNHLLDTIAKGKTTCGPDT